MAVVATSTSHHDGNPIPLWGSKSSATSTFDFCIENYIFAGITRYVELQLGLGFVIFSLLDAVFDDAGFFLLMLFFSGLPFYAILPVKNCHKLQYLLYLKRIRKLDKIQIQSNFWVLWLFLGDLYTNQDQAATFALQINFSSSQFL